MPPAALSATSSSPLGRWKVHLSLTKWMDPKDSESTMGWFGFGEKGWRWGDPPVNSSNFNADRWSIWEKLYHVFLGHPSFKQAHVREVKEDRNWKSFYFTKKMVGGIPTPLKNDEVRQLGWWHFQYDNMMGKSFKIPWFQPPPTKKEISGGTPWAYRAYRPPGNGRCAKIMMLEWSRF